AHLTIIARIGERWLPATAFPEERFECGSAQRTGEVEPLGEGAVQHAEDVKLFLSLHALGDDVDPQPPSHGEDPGDDGGVVIVGAEAVDEASVDLEHVDGEPLEVAERRVAGAEVVDGELPAEGLETEQRLPGAAAASTKHAPGQL